VQLRLVTSECNCTLIMEDSLIKLQKRAATAVLDVNFTVPSETMFTQLK